MLKKNDRQQHQHQTLLDSDRLNDKIKKTIHVIIKENIKIHDIENDKSISSTSEEKLFILLKKKLDIIQQMHDQSTTNHSDVKRIMQFLQRYF